MTIPYSYWKEWQEKTNKFLKKEWLFTLVVVGIIGGLHFLKQYFPISTSTRIILGSVFFLFLVLIAVLLLAGSSAFLGKKEGEKETSKEGVYFGGIIRNVPANMIWVLRRSIFGSNIQTHEGYVGKKEGFRFKIPLYHEDLGLIDLSPIPRDPKPITVNTKDNQTAIIDWRIETFINGEKGAIDFVVRVNDNREKFEDQKISVIINQLAAAKTQDELTRFEKNDLQEMGTDALNRFIAEVTDLGITPRAIEIKNIQMPEEIRDVAEYATVSKKRRDIAVDKAAELETIIAATKADPSKVVIAEMIRGAVVDGLDAIANIFLKSRKEEKK